MDFLIAKKDLNAVLRQILQGRTIQSADLVDFTVNGSTLNVAVTGRSTSVDIEAQERGAFSVPIGVLFKAKRILGSYDEESLRIRIAEGKFRLQGMSLNNPEIKPRKVARRIIDIPDDAHPRDILALPFILSLEEIEDCGLQTKLLEAQKKMAEHIDSAANTLRPYGFDRNDLATMAKLKIATHADALKHVLFSED